MTSQQLEVKEVQIHSLDEGDGASKTHHDTIGLESPPHCTL